MLRVKARTGICNPDELLRRRYGCFAGAETRKFPGVKRISGIPSIVIIGPTGDKLNHIDCDDQALLADWRKRGVSVLDEWQKYAWK